MKTMSPSASLQPQLSFNYGKRRIVLQQIKYMESIYGNYTLVKLHDTQPILSSFTLKHYATQLGQVNGFFNVRKGLLINLRYLVRVECRADGHYAILEDGNQFRMSRRKGKELLLYLDSFPLK